jgi:urease alpha subunit
MGDPNASIPTPQPYYSRPMFAALGSAVGTGSLAFTSAAGLETVQSYGLKKRAVAVKGCRSVGKKDMRLNDAMPNVTVDPETYAVHADGKLLTCEPATELPLAQLYHLF